MAVILRYCTDFGSFGAKYVKVADDIPTFLQQKCSPKSIAFIALHAMQTRSSDKKALCPSVCPSDKRVNYDKTGERLVQIFIPYERLFILVFRKEEWLVGVPLLPEILGQPVGAKSLIFNR